MNVANVGPSRRLFFDTTTTAAAGKLDISDIPAGQGYEITVVGRNAGGQPTHLARQQGVGIAVGETTNLSLTAVPYNDTACLSVEQAGNLPHRIFPAATALGDGRVFVTGGFSAITGAGSQRLAAASNQTFIVNTRTGEVKAGPNLNEGRAAHAMIHIPTRNAILIVGGAKEMPFNDDGSQFGFGYDAATVISSVEIVDLSGGDIKVVPGTLTMQRQRVFPQLALIAADRVVVSGGGGWPSPAGAFAAVDYIVWDSGGNTFRIASGEFFAQDTAARAGHTVTLLRTETVQNSPQNIFLVWGGQPGDARASLLVAPTDPNAQPVFQAPSLVGDTPERTYFHSATRLRDDTVLALGGVSLQNNSLSGLSGATAYLLRYGKQDGGGQTVSIQQLSGLPGGRVFHSALSHDLRRVTIVGGFTGLAGGATSDVAYFDGSSFSFEPAPRSPLAPRAGHAAVFTSADALYLAGGVDTLADLQANERILSEVFVPGGVTFCDAPKFDPDELPKD